MNSPTTHPKRPFSKKWQRVLLHLLAIVVALGVGLPEAQKVHAAPAADAIICSLNNGCPVYPPPDLLYLNQGGIYAATPAQAASLKNLENKAVNNLINARNLSPADNDAVRSWGRSEAHAELYGLLLQAITAESPTTDQQNAVDWITAVVQRQNLKAAEAAGREYVKWAGLDRSTYESLLRNNASQSDLKSFLSGTPVNYNHTDIGLADGGWCVYRSPAPYGSEYTGYTDVLCTNPCPFICFPPTPSYDQFVKWGESVTTYPLLSSGYYLSASTQIALGLSFGLTMAAAAVATIPIYVLTAAYTSSVAGSLLGVTAPTAAVAAAAAAEGAADVAAVASFTVGGALALVTFILVALTTAIIAGITVTDAAKLPEKLAELIANARTDVPDLKTLAEDDEGAVTLFSLFVGVTAPTPDNRTCDNTLLGLPPGLYPLETSSGTTLLPSVPCLNPTDIPPPSATDPQFIVTAKDATTGTAAPSITWKNTASGTTTTARLYETWFITQANGATAQTLRIAYTDWDGKQQNAWLLGNPAEGYTFITFTAPADSSTTVSYDTCIADGYCSHNSSIYYVGADGQKYSATVRGYLPSTGAPTYSANPVETKPITFKANNFAPTEAVGPITYKWRFDQSTCAAALSCGSFDYASGATATYTWQASSSFGVELTATDAQGVPATTYFRVSVAALPPSVKLAPDCSTSPSVPCNTSTVNAASTFSLRGTVNYAGSYDLTWVIVNWGDGEQDVENQAFYPTPLATRLALTLSPWNPQSLTYEMLGTHTYATPGTYYGIVTAVNGTDGNGYGGAATQNFVVTVKGQQTITFPAIGGHSYGDVFTVSATGGASGQPVTFAITSSPPACVLSNVSGGAGTGSATVTVTSAGLCDITANQAGTTVYNPAPSVTQRFFILPAVLTVKASSPTITYGETAPAITPSYSGFKNGDAESVLTAPATCVTAPNSGGAGTYATTCSGAAAPNYSVNYQPGTLTINKAPLTVTANNKSMIYGSTVPSFDAQYSGLVNGDTSAVVSGLSCVAKNGSTPVSSNSPAGSYPITCGGASAANYSLSYVAGTLTIDKAGTTTALSSSPSPSVYGQSVTFTAAVSVNTPGTGHPSGTVAFKDGGSDIAGCAARPVDPATGTAICTTAALTVAQHGVTATYSGDSNFVGSSTASAVMQTVNKAAVTTTLNAAANPSTFGQTVTFTAAVAAAAPGAGTPTGSVTFKDGATTLGAGTLSTSNGTTVASFTASGLSVGAHTITASYSGDGNFLVGGATLTQYINTNLSGYPKLPNGAYNLSNANLVGGYFVNAALAGANLSGSNLTSAVFLGANLSGANLSNSNFKGANFAGANLTGANLTGVNLKEATGLKTATLTNVIWNKTTCPDSTISNNNGGTCIGHL